MGWNDPAVQPWRLKASSSGQAVAVGRGKRGAMWSYGNKLNWTLGWREMAKGTTKEKNQLMYEAANFRWGKEAWTTYYLFPHTFAYLLGAYVPWCAPSGQKTTSMNWFAPTTMCVQGSNSGLRLGSKLPLPTSWILLWVILILSQWSFDILFKQVPSHLEHKTSAMEQRLLLTTMQVVSVGYCLLHLLGIAKLERNDQPAWL